MGSKLPEVPILLIWIIVGQGPIVHAVGADGGCLDIFSLIYLCPSLGDGLIQTEIWSQRAVKSITFNHFFTREVIHDNINLDHSLFQIFSLLAFIKKNQY